MLSVPQSQPGAPLPVVRASQGSRERRPDLPAGRMRFKTPAAQRLTVASDTRLCDRIPPKEAGPPLGEGAGASQAPRPAGPRGSPHAPSGRSRWPRARHQQTPARSGPPDLRLQVVSAARPASEPRS